MCNEIICPSVKDFHKDKLASRKIFASDAPCNFVRNYEEVELYLFRQGQKMFLAP